MPNPTVECLKCAIFLFVVLTTVCMAQDASNRRGFQPGNSFAIGDFETINTTNGNLMLRFPLGALPGGRNGLSGGINLYYNSKIYDSETQWFSVENQSCEIIGDSGEGILKCPYYQKSVLKESPEGGWQFGTMYSLKLIDRRDQFLNIPTEKQPQCLNTNVYGSWSPGYLEMRYHYKLVINFPDGSSHEMRPNGWTDGNFNDPLADWFDIRPDGYWHDCHSTQWYQNTITYYSTDGSFLRLDIQHDNDTDPMNNPWTLYFPDGSKVTSNQPNNEPQRVYDRNNNYLELLGGEVKDQFNRSVSVSISWNDGDPISTVTSQGFGQTLTWTIHWKWISVLRNYWPCAQSLQCPPEVQQQEPYGMPRLVIDKITMPVQTGGLTYQFQYNAPDHVSGQPLTPSLGWGEISGITLPSGAQVNYTWAQDGAQPISVTPDILKNSPTTKSLTYNQEYDGNSTPVTETWTYVFEGGGYSSITAPDGGVTENHFIDVAGAFWNAGLTFRTIAPNGTKTETIWERNNLASSGSSNPYPKTVFTSIKNAAEAYVKTSIKDYKYDKNGNVTRIAEYDWVNYDDVPRSFGMPTGLPSAPPTRVTVNTYFNATPDATQFAGSNTSVYWSSGSPRVKNALASTEIRKVLPGGAEAAVSRVEYVYDNPSAPANMIEARTWDSTKGLYSSPLTAGNSLLASSQYNQYGMPTLVTDARGLKTFTTYGSVGGFSDLYPTQIKTAYQTPQERTENREYHLGTGLVTRVTDVDNNISTSTSFDVLGRPLLITAAEGKPEETRTAYQYSDLLRRVVTRSDLNTAGDGKLVSIEHFDQLGRLRLSRQLEDASSQSQTDETTGIKVQTRYRFSGANSYVLVSNAYRAATSGAASAEPTMGWTRTKSDRAGRTIEVQTFGGAGLPAPWNSNTTSTGTVSTVYDANLTTVSDQTQRVRRSVFDGLGRLIRVDEPNASGSLGDPGSPNQPTHYGYDVLDNLISVAQSDGTTTQQRTFVFSSLSRLTQATTPESGTTSYRFDEVGNVVVRTDARGVSTHYTFDSLNRLTRRWYNGSSSVSATSHESALPGGAATTDEVKFYYDLQTLPQGAPSYSRGAAVGKLVAQIYGSGTNGDYLGYDGVGRAILKFQQTGSVNYRLAATFNLADRMTSLTYPSDHTVTNTFDPAGRLTGFNGNIGDGTSRTYSTGILYSPAGAMVKEQFGTNTAIYNKLFYNSRGQLAEVRASTSYSGPADMDADRGAIINSYSDQCNGICSGFSMTDNNGNLKKQDVLIPNQQTHSQQYDYDSLNRLKWAREVANNVEQWKQQFTYDRWGNRGIDTAVTYGLGVNNKSAAINPGTNKLLVPNGQSGVIEYDAVGNVKNDTYTGAGARSYDAENKITSAGGWNNQTQLYSYDGSGQRIKRTANGVQTWHVYGFGGELLAEYSANGAANLPQKEYGFRNGQLLVTAEPSTVAPVNVASAANGATATASSSFSGFAASGAINGDRKGLFVAQNGYWSTAGPGFTAWLEVQFNGSKTIKEVDVVTAQDNYNAPVEPTESTTFSLYGLTAYQIEYWNGTAWTVIPGAAVSANNRVWKKFTFAPVTTTKIRVVTNASTDNYSRITEVEAWTGPSPAPRYNLALASQGAVATASNSYNSGYGPAGANNGDRKSANWTNGGGWNDSGPPFPDWLQIDFGAVKTINEVNVFTLQDNYANSVEPTESMTFTLWGLTGYQLQYWDGSNWISPPNCSVTGNNKIWRKFTFAAISTNKIRVLANASVDGYSRITEVEAYAPADTGASGNGVHWLVADHLGTPRMIFDQTGDLSNMRRHDYLPFGEELFAPTGGRTAAQGYAGDGIRQQFTAKERDIETSLDYYGARYYSSAAGRFLSCDPDAYSSRHVVNPQRWNLYSHVLNNPLALFDPNGQTDQTKDKTRVIVDIFLFSDPDADGADKMTQSQRQALENIVRQGKRVGVEITIFEGPADSTGPAAANSLRSSDVVLFGPHTGAPEGGEAVAVPTQDGLFTRGGLNMAGEVEPRPIEVNASVVGVFGCDSARVRHVFYGANTFIGVNGGSDHVSTTYGLNEAIIATVRAIVRANGDLGPKTIATIDTKAQTAIRNSYPGKDQDDTVIVNPAVAPPAARKTPYEEEEL